VQQKRIIGNRPTVSPSQFAGNYHLQSRLADIQKGSPTQKLQTQPRAVPPREEQPEDIVYDDEDDVTMHEDHVDEQAENRSIQQNKPSQDRPQENSWLASVRQSKPQSQPPSSAHQSRNDFVKSIRSVGYQGRLRTAIASISGGLTLLNHSLHANKGSQPKLSQSVGEESIVVRVIYFA
jgi:hypothetical protein